MVAARLLEVDGRIDGAGGFWIEQLPPARSASGSIYEKCRVDHSGKISLLRDGNASPNWSNSLDRDDRGRTSDQVGRQSAPSGEWRRDGHFCPGIRARSLRSGALETIRRAREAFRPRRVQRVHRQVAPADRSEERRWTRVSGRRNTLA